MDNLKPWNGIFGGYRYTHPEGLEIAPDGCIYYTNGDGQRCIWCGPGRLRSHLHHLFQISHQRPDDIPIVEIWQEVTA